MSKPPVTILGLGHMGSGMAASLLKAGFPVTVYNRNAAKATPLAAQGAKIGASPREAAASSKIIISMLADDAASREVWLGPDGALSGAGPGAILIESSTISVAWLRELAAAAQARHCVLLDAPVTGSRTHAAAGELTFLVGGPFEALETARPVLAAMSRAIVHLGPSGSGTLLKLINNFLCGVQVASLAEGIALIEKSGLDRTKALEILTQGAPGSPLFKNLSARMTARDYTPHFLLRLMAKDLDYAITEGLGHSIPLATAEAALEVFTQAIKAGQGDRDFSAVIEPIRNP